VRVVDTSVFIDAERRRTAAVERLARLAAQGGLAVSAVTVYELTCGPATPPGRLAHYLELFEREARVLPVSHLSARCAADAARAAPGIKTPDALIAGAALEHGLAVVTSDSDFLRVPGLEVEWVASGPAAHEPLAAWRAAPAGPEAPATGARLRALRLAAGRTASEVAAAAGMARSNYSRLENGRHQPATRTLRRAALALGVPLAELLRA
jgi:predicted nucleic acid-binding protein/DNA-binding XRE family transcriptional regulator